MEVHPTSARFLTGQMKNNSKRYQMARFCAALCGVLVAAVNAYAGSQQGDLDWLKVVAFAGHQTDYSGIFVYQYDNRVETSRITHVVEMDGEYEKLESLDGPKREIIRHHGQVWCYINHKMIQMNSQGQTPRSRFADLLPEQLSSLSANYQANEVGMERVAGYNTQVIFLRPNDSLRYAHKIWVHTDSGLLLKASVLNEKNEVVEQYAFTQLQLNGNIDRSWIVRDVSAGKQKVESIIPSDNSKGITEVNSGWTADFMPTGFRKTKEISRAMYGKHRPVTQMVYSDGLSAVSIFIEPDDKDEDDIEGLFSRGAVNVYHKVTGSHLITVVGEVPPRTLIQVYHSVRFNGR